MNLDIALMSPQAQEGVAGLLEWSQPVIHDRLRSTYKDYVQDSFSVARLARLHARVWRCLLTGDMCGFESARTELVLHLSQVGLTLDHLAAADNQTMSELVEIVIARFRRSPHLSQAYHMALLQLASFLQPARAA